MGSGAQRIVITGMGAVSSIGTGLDEISSALRAGRSGLVCVPDWVELGICSAVAGVPESDPKPTLGERRLLKTTTKTGLMALRATNECLEVAGIEPPSLRGQEVPVLIGTGVSAPLEAYQAAHTLKTRGSSRRLSPYTITRCMASSASAVVSVALGVTGESWSLSAACSTGAHAIRMGCLLIETGRAERVIVGASEELDWTRAAAFDAMHALSRGFNERPASASRPFDRDRDGFVLSGGAGVLLLESLESAQSRGAKPLSEILGHAATSDGYDMVRPSSRGAIRVMKRALESAAVQPSRIEYVNAHGTSTPTGDASEAAAMAEVFGPNQPLISSTKSATGHAVGAAGSLEVIYTVQMMREGFVAPSLNVDHIDPECDHLNLQTQPNFESELNVTLSNSFGFGGTNTSIVLGRMEGDA